MLVGKKPDDAGADSGEGFWGAETVRSVDIAAVLDELFEGGDADFEEFVEVGADDGEEFETFEERLGGILGFFEYALVEFEPTEFTIEVR